MRWPLQRGQGCAWPWSGAPRPPPQAESEENGHDEIAQTLKRFQKENLTARYYQCDISDPTAVKELVRQIREDLGDVTGVIHGAGINRPRPAEQVTPDEARSEIAPKVLGAVNLCEALLDAPLKAFLCFLSIIGISGMVRNAWYGFSNEALSLVMGRYREKNPRVHTLCIAYSIWDEVGMGVRLGSRDFLAEKGIGAIPKEEGINRFLHLLSHDSGQSQIVVTARLAGVDTWRPETFPMPSASRFLEKATYYYPRVEIASRVHLSLAQDAYLKDHIWRGTHLFPTVFGLEAMAQAVAYVTGKSGFQDLKIEDILLEMPITVGPEAGTEIEIRAEALERESETRTLKVRAGISTEQTGFTANHFSATFVLSEIQQPPVETVQIPKEPLDIDPKRDLYRWLLFQGPLYQRILKIHTLESRRCVFSSAVDLPEKTAGWILGDPYFRDSLLQSMQILVSQDTCLPVRIGNIECFRPARPAKEQVCVVILEERIDNQYRGNVFAVDAGGHVTERIIGYFVQILEHHAGNPTPEEIAAPGDRDARIIGRELTHRAEKLALMPPEISVAHIPALQKIFRPMGGAKSRLQS